MTTSNKNICLCLHGCNQTPTAFQSYLSSLRKMASKKQYNIDLQFLTAQFEHHEGSLTWTDPPLNVTDIWHDKDSPYTRDNPLSAVLKLPYDYDIIKDSIEDESYHGPTGFHGW